MEMTVKQEKFCVEFAKTGNARNAYINAGYKCLKESTIDAAASRLLNSVKVQKRLAELTEATRCSDIADITEMQTVLTKIIRQAITEEVIVTEGIGDGCTEAKSLNKAPAIKDVISAITTLGKMQGLFTEKVSVDMKPVVISGGDQLED